MAGKRHRRRSSRKSKSCGMMWGGAGAPDHAISVYGDMGQQKVGTNGAIYENPLQTGGAPLSPSSVQMGGAPLSPSPVQMGGAPAPLKIGGAHLSPSPVQMGGAHLSPADFSSASIRGGSTGVDLAVPAVLLLANQSFKRRRNGSSKKRRGSFRRRRSNRRR